MSYGHSCRFQKVLNIYWLPKTCRDDVIKKHIDSAHKWLTIYTRRGSGKCTSCVPSHRVRLFSCAYQTMTRWSALPSIFALDRHFLTSPRFCITLTIRTSDLPLDLFVANADYHTFWCWHTTWTVPGTGIKTQEQGDVHHQHLRQTLWICGL